MAFNRIELCQQRHCRLGRCRALDRAQLAVPAIDARADAQLDQRRQHARQGDQHRDDRQQRQPHAVDDIGQPERQVALQPGYAAAVEALRLGREFALAVARVRKVALALEPTRLPVHLVRGLHEQLRQRRVQAVAGHQGRGGGDHVDVAGGQVAGQVDHAARQRHGGQEAEAPGVGVGLGEVEQLYAGGLQQHLHHQRLGRRGQHDGIELAFEQVDHGRGLRLLQQGDGGGVDAVGVEQALRQVGYAAAGRADVDAPAGELGQALEPRRLQQLLRTLGAVEQPHRLVEHAAQRGQAGVGVLAAAAIDVGTALRESQVNAGARVAQQRQVFRRTLGGPQLDDDAVPCQPLGVAFAELAVGALVDAGGQHHALGWVGVEPQIGQQQQQRGERHERQCRAGEDAPGRQGGFVRVGGGTAHSAVRSDQISGNSTTSSILRR